MLAIRAYGHFEVVIVTVKDVSSDSLELIPDL